MTKTTYTRESWAGELAARDTLVIETPDDKHTITMNVEGADEVAAAFNRVTDSVKQTDAAVTNVERSISRSYEETHNAAGERVPYSQSVAAASSPRDEDTLNRERPAAHGFFTPAQERAAHDAAFTTVKSLMLGNDGKPNTFFSPSYVAMAVVQDALAAIRKVS